MNVIVGYLFAIISLTISASSIYYGNLYNLSHNISMVLYTKKVHHHFNVAPTLSILLFSQTLTYFFSFYLLSTSSDLIITVFAFLLQFIRFIHILLVLDKNRTMDLYYQVPVNGEILDVITNALCFAHVLLLFLQ